MPGLHAVLSPSSAKRWLTCTPSARLEEKLRERFGDKSSVFAEAGTKAHSLAELKLRKATGEINDFSYQEQVKALGEIPSDMDWATDTYLDTVMREYLAAKQNCPDAILRVEQRIDMDPWAPKCFGTSDATVVSDGILVVLDYKNGSGVPVSAVDNPQARLYGLGAVNAFGDLYGFRTVKNVIVQPHLDSITDETMTKQDLLDWGDSIKPAADLAWKGEGEYVPGDHCKFCKAKALCYARAAQCMKLLSDSAMQNPGVIPDSEIPGILEFADQAEAWIKDIKEYAQGQALHGQNWPGWKLVSGRRPPAKWADNDAVIDQMARAGYTENQIYEKKLISVAEAKKLMGAPAFRALLGQFSVQGDGAPTLVPTSDKRLAINSAENAFADLVNDTTTSTTKQEEKQS
jgi:hypothetical protein